MKADMRIKGVEDSGEMVKTIRNCVTRDCAVWPENRIKKEPLK
jgi:hypothetical protein